MDDCIEATTNPERVIAQLRADNEKLRAELDRKQQEFWDANRIESEEFRKVSAELAEYQNMKPVAWELDRYGNIEYTSRKPPEHTNGALITPLFAHTIKDKGARK